jgi:YXWGXW repeat-containing protein
MNLQRLGSWLVIAALILSLSAASLAQVAVGISVRIGPPALPVYAQPICPGPGYMWTPGYWAWNDDDGYYWVPGTWVVAPVGLLWTPGYWGWSDGFYFWHAGYWGPHIGFYGGIPYGYGYTGVGFYGGEWRGRNFYYNRSVSNVNVTNVTNVYNKTVIVNNTTVNNVSYNGGNGGIQARPSPQEEAAARERHEAPLPAQAQHQQAASQNKQLFASVNHGRPAVAATARPSDFHSAVPAKAAGAPYHAPAMSAREARGPAPGNRPFNQPASNGSRSANNRPIKPPNGSNANSRSNQGYHPYTPPSNNNRGGNTVHTNDSRPPQHETAPRPSAPRHESAPPPEHREQSSPPKNEHHPGR